MPSPSSALPAGRAVVLGVLHGPAELLPVSSSAHTATIPWLFGWRYGELDPERRKSFEVALHLGTALALATVLRDELPHWREGQTRLLIAAASTPPALAGLALERMIEARLGTPATIAAGLALGSGALILADHATGRRTSLDAGARDGLWLGLAQSLALVPGVSRAGATLSAARLLGFEAASAQRLSEQVGLPVLLGASALKAIRLWRRGVEPALARSFAAGAGASFCSTLVLARAPRSRRLERLLPYALYRAAVAALILVRLRRGSTARW